MTDFGPREQRQGSAEDLLRDQPSEVSAGRADADALARVVLESVGRFTEADQLIPGNVEAFLSVARRRPGEQFSNDPVAKELVEEAILDFFGRKDARSIATWQWLAARVSDTLCKDAASRKTLERFWTLLQRTCAKVGATDG